MEVRLALSLPRDCATVPLTRRVLDSALAELGITTDCRDDIGLAVGEACANAVQHAPLGTGYWVTIMIRDDRCVIDVVDGGAGVDPEGVPAAGPDDEAGRGLWIICAVADAVELRQWPLGGAGLRIVKGLTHSPSATV